MGFLLIFDLTNEKSFIEITNWLEQLRRHAYSEDPDIVLCGNKCDLETFRVIPHEQVMAFVERYNLPYIETSASTGFNVHQAVDLLIGRVIARMENSTSNMELTRLMTQTRLSSLQTLKLALQRDDEYAKEAQSKRNCDC